MICFNKNDLTDEASAAEWSGIYKDAGYETFSCSVKNGIGMEPLEEALDKKTTVIAGPSGVGKSSFINHFVPAAKMETGQTSRTATSAQSSRITRRGALLSSGRSASTATASHMAEKLI